MTRTTGSGVCHAPRRSRPPRPALAEPWPALAQPLALHFLVLGLEILPFLLALLAVLFFGGGALLGGLPIAVAIFPLVFVVAHGEVGVGLDPFLLGDLGFLQLH